MWPRIRSYGGHALEYGLTFLAAVTINFALPYVAPGDPLLYILGGSQVQDLTPQERQEVLAAYGLDQPLHVQFVDYLLGIPRGELGTSIIYGDPVLQVLLQRLPWTLVLVGSALVAAAVLGTVFGAWSAWREGQRVDLGLMTSLVTVMSAPTFWIGMLLIAVFSAWLGWFPAYGIRSLGSGDSVVGFLWDLAVHLTLPLVTLTVGRIGGIYLIARGSVLSTLGEDFLLFSKANGLPDGKILLGHALPNSLLPIYTRFTLQVGSLVGGAVVVETVFSYPGLGLLIYDAAIARDYPLLQGAFLVLTITVIAANIFADLTYPFLDPRTGGPNTQRAVE